MIAEPTQEEIQEALQISFDLVDRAAETINGFKFRGEQRNVCAAILTQYQLDPETAIILEAPTGSGKSIIAKICIIAITLLEPAANGFVLTSDRLLQAQYDNSCSNMLTRTSYGNLFGAGNYTCSQNNLPHPEGVCHVQRLNTAQIKELECYKTCGYFQARLRAQNSKIALLNYNNWLLHMNIVNGGKDVGVIFDRRTVTFFDECHKVGDIVQDMFGFTLYTVSIKKAYDELQLIYKFHQDLYHAMEIKIPEYGELLDSKNKVLGLITSINEKLDTKLVVEQLQSIDEEFDQLSRFHVNTIELLSRQFFGNGEIIFDKLPKDWQDILKTFEKFDGWRNEYRMYIQSLYRDYDTRNLEIGEKPEILHSNLVVDEEIYNNETFGITEKRLNFRSIDIRNLMNRYVIRQSNFKVFMSASIGDIDRYAKLNGFIHYKPIQINSNFKFENSGIVRVCRHNLAAKHKAENIGPAIELVDQLLSHPSHLNQRGIIHSGNYEFAKMLKSYSKHADRMLVYQGTEEKLEMLERHKLQTNSILVGPSLIEGVDLVDDLARVQILFKVPYPSLGDNLNRKKLELIEGWYEYATLLNIVQMLGRPIRHEDDWCAMYLIDSNFKRFFDEPHASRLFPQYITRRIK